jgi:hypothetical protein
MMSQSTDHGEAGHTSVPRSVRLVGFIGLSVALAGAAYLIWARGEAMIVDLATLAGKVWCF